MIVGIPKEIKPGENRVSLTPAAVRSLSQNGHPVLVERKAGIGSGWGDREYREADARIVGRAELFRLSEIVVKVKEPQDTEVRFFCPGQILFTFLHLAANQRLRTSLRRRRVVAIAYETVEGPDGSLPLLKPMSEIAGRLASLIGANYLRKDLGGKGILLSDRGRGQPASVLILGAGSVGHQAASAAHAMGAAVTAYDINPMKLERLRQQVGQDLRSASGGPEILAALVAQTDLLIGAVLVPGARTPRIVTRSMVRRMEPGSVIIDVAVDQGGCIETIRPTTLKNPVYTKYGVLHCGVTNLPALVPRTATEALTAVTLPYLLKIAEMGVDRALAADPGLAKGLIG